MKSIKLPTEIENQICQDYKNLITKKQIQAKYKIGWRVLNNILNRNNIKTNGQELYLTGRKKLSMYDYWVIKHGKEQADVKMKEYGKKRSKLHSGKNNPMYGKPVPKGCGQGWKGYYKDFYFRSLRELSYLIYLDENNIKWESAESKKFTIKYRNYDGTHRTYRPDFLINDRILIEIKPKRLQKSPLILLKTAAAIEFCENKNLEYQIIDFPINKYKIQNELNKGNIKFSKNYKQKFLNYNKDI